MGVSRLFLFILLGFIFVFLCVYTLVAPDIAAEQLNTLLNTQRWNLYNIRILGIVEGVIAAILIIRGIRL
jgi:predicted transglutaminase-like protease